MAAPDHPPRHSPIKTPRELVIVVALAFAVPIILIGLLATLATSGLKGEGGALDDEAVAKRIAPVAQVTIAAPASETKKGGKSAEQVLQGTCAACHQTGAAGAPKVGDRAAWAPRIAKGLKPLVDAAVKGIRAMPPRGGDSQLTDAEVEDAVILMANQSGANFKEPAQGKEAAQGKDARQGKKAAK
jgi:cytochrome c5